MITKVSYIKKLPSGEFRVMSHKGRNMGTYKSRKQAEQRLRSIEFWKHQDAADDVGNKIREADKDPNHYYDRGGIGDVPSFWRKNLDYGERERILNKKLAKLVDSLEKLGFDRDSKMIKELLAVI